ncbi:MAG: hypothetical protein AMXMBFR58_28230 [Phycisphaerae bacterium]
MDPSPAAPSYAVPEELWARLRRFDPQCFISLVRSNPYSPKWKAARRTWQVRIHHDGARAWESIQVEHPTLAEALREAVELAEKWGWARPISDGPSYGQPASNA